MKKLVALFTLILWSISTAASAAGSMSVLCVEKSGNVSIEYSFGTRCVDKDEVVAADAQMQAAVSDAHCPSCVDSSLSAPTASFSTRIAAKSLAADPVALPVAILPSPVLVHVNGMRAPPEAAPLIIRSAYLAQRETIVILQ
jgi:hypothetical protein